MDYLVLVNKSHPLPAGWEEGLKTVTTVNSVGDEVETEQKTYEAYLLLEKDLEENEGIRLEMDSALRSIRVQQDILDRFTEKYGPEETAKLVAPPGCSEHHTGLAVDLYFRLSDGNGGFRDVCTNEELERQPDLWKKIHARLADYGFILRYPEGKEAVTGYTYEPWHIRYVGDPAVAKDIMRRPGMTLEEWLERG